MIMGLLRNSNKILQDFLCVPCNNRTSSNKKDVSIIVMEGWKMTVFVPEAKTVLKLLIVVFMISSQCIMAVNQSAALCILYGPMRVEMRWRACARQVVCQV